MGLSAQMARMVSAIDGALGRGVGRAPHLPRIPQIDWAGRTEGRGNAGQTADSFFHPSGPSGFSHLIPPKSLNITTEALVGFRGDGAHHLTKAAIRAPSRAFPRRRALCTNSK